MTLIIAAVFGVGLFIDYGKRKNWDQLTLEDKK